MKKPIIISDPYPRNLKLIFNDKTFKKLKNKYILIYPPKKNKNNFYRNNIHKVTFIMGQPNLPTSVLRKAKKLKAIFNVESNFLNNMDYDFCFRKNIHVLSTSPVFARPVAELALGLTLSLLREIHINHNNFINNNEKYGLTSNENAKLLTNKKIGLIGFGDLGKSLLPLIKPFTNQIFIYDPWISSHTIKKEGVKPTTFNNLLKISDVIYILASVTTKNIGLIGYRELNMIKKGSLIILMSRAALIKFPDLIKKIKKGHLYFATDVFPKEPVQKNNTIRRLKNVILSAHRAGALRETFKDMGEIVYNDMNLIIKNLPPKFCKKAELRTVKLLRSKPVDIS